MGGNKVGPYRTIQFVQPPSPPAPYASFDEMDIVTLRDYLRAKDLAHGWMGTNIHKDEAVGLANGTLTLLDVARMETDRIIKRRRKLTDGKLRGWLKKYTPKVLAEIGEEVDLIIDPTLADLADDDDDEEEIDDMGEPGKMVPNLFSLLNNGFNTKPATTPAPAPAPAQALSIPTLNVPKVEPKVEPKPEPAKTEPKVEPAKAVTTAAAAEVIDIPDIRKHAQWATLAAVAKGLGIDLDGFMNQQEQVHGATVAALNDRDKRIRFLHQNVAKFIEGVFTEPNVPNA